jgi:hypothetical protein
MKRMGGTAILLAIMAIPAQAQAQRLGRMRGPAGPDEIWNRERARDLSADAMIRQRESLNLSDEQVERIKEAQAADRAARDAQRLEAREIRDRLRDEEITRYEFREELQSRRSSTMDGRIAHREALEGILSTGLRFAEQAPGSLETSLLEVIRSLTEDAWQRPAPTFSPMPPDTGITGTMGTPPPGYDEQRSQMRELRTQVNRGQRARGGRAGRTGFRDRGQGLSGPRAQRGGRPSAPGGLREASGHAYAAEL